MPYLDRDAARIYYEDRGAGAAVLLTHGYESVDFLGTRASTSSARTVDDPISKSFPARPEPVEGRLPRLSTVSEGEGAEESPQGEGHGEGGEMSAKRLVVSSDYSSNLRRRTLV